MTFPVQPVDHLSALVGAGPEVVKLMPKYEDIPQSFKGMSANKWSEFARTWFFHGLKNLEVTTKPGIDRGKALAHLAAIQRSWSPSHEHKEAAVAFLASEWFEDVKFEAKRDDNG